MLTVILTGLGSRFSRPVHGYFNGLGVRGDLRRGRGHGNRQREALSWKNNYFHISFLSLSFFFLLFLSFFLSFLRSKRKFSRRNVAGRPVKLGGNRINRR